ncbi:MAG TPA: EI24 domain-containing protein [Burkholderiaceae bacterium]|nr:EI24 domain-containing protein [Burkholderiaceae bacterium]
MNLFLDSFWRAVAYCVRPRVIALSFLPLILMVAVALGLGYLYWEPAIDWVRTALEGSSMVNNVWGWLQGIGLGSLKTVLAPLVVIFLVTPIIVVVSLLVVAVLMTPALVSLVAERRFPALERKKGSSTILSVFWSLGSTLLALIALVISVPLWLVPPLILILPPLIWGWLTYRVMTFDALAGHASKEERRELIRRHRGWLFGMGVMTGYLGAAPSLVWASGALFAAAFVVLVPLAIWIYTLVFAFSSLWFSHYCLAALQALRAELATPVAPAVTPGKPLPLRDDSIFTDTFIP